MAIVNNAAVNFWVHEAVQISEHNKTETDSQIQRKTSGYHWKERKAEGKVRGRRLIIINDGV